MLFNLIIGMACILSGIVNDSPTSLVLGIANIAIYNMTKE